MDSLYQVKIHIEGMVQGVGFRPFIYNLANTYKMVGNVKNTSEGVFIIVEGYENTILNFIKNIKIKQPLLSNITNISIIEKKEIRCYSWEEFSIINTVKSINSTFVPPDSCICLDCLSELFDKKNSRYKYPFINCINCGPRYSIIQTMPYDRISTTMHSFEMCKDCYSEYNYSKTRRFHSQPNSCWKCGPVLKLLKNNKIISNIDIISLSILFLKKGKILAIKGIGGFHLVVNPFKIESIMELRRKKQRKKKPFALMMRDIDTIQKYCKVNLDEIKILSSKERPILLLEKILKNELTESIAPNSNYLGVMLPYTPLHHLLLKKELDILIYTSANLKDEPIIYVDNYDEHQKLNQLCDYIITNNRKICTPIDDSICFYLKNDLQITRRARGYTPKPISFSNQINISKDGMALGSGLKNTICVNKNNNFFISQYIGNIQNKKIAISQSTIITHFTNLFKIIPSFIAVDMHPSFIEINKKNFNKNIPIIKVQHHHAHMASCMIENNLNTEVIGVIYDGTGYGSDGNLWGGEFFVGDYTSFERVGHFKYIKLLGGDKAIKEPYRIALALLFDIFGKNIPNIKMVTSKDIESIEFLYKMYVKNIYTFSTSSVGRLFDALSALLNICEYIEYEGQAAIELEQHINLNTLCEKQFKYKIIRDEKILQVDTQFLFKEIMICILDKQYTKDIISVMFHNTICAITVEILLNIREQKKINKVVLSGGVFQNKYLLKRCIDILEKHNFNVFIHKEVPTNDGGISIGQLIIGHHVYENKKKEKLNI